MSDRDTRSVRHLNLKAGDVLEHQFRRLEDAPAARSRRRLKLFAGSVPVLLAALLLTPLGATVAGAIGSLAGVGDEPTLPVEEGERGIVIGAGEISSANYPYELVAETNAGNESCFGLELPTIRVDHSSGVCLTSDSSREQAASTLNHAYVSSAPRQLYPEAQLILQGLASTEISSIEVEYTDAEGVAQSLRTDVAPLDEPLTDQLGVEDRIGFYFVGIPPGMLRTNTDGVLTYPSAGRSLAGITLTGYAPDGSLVRSDRPFADGAPAFSQAATGVMVFPVPGLRSEQVGYGGEVDRAEKLRPTPRWRSP